MRGDPANVEITEVVYYFAFDCCDKTLTKVVWRGKGFSHHPGLRSQFITEGSKGRRWEPGDRNLEQPWRNAVSWLAQLPSIYTSGLLTQG